MPALAIVPQAAEATGVLPAGWAVVEEADTAWSFEAVTSTNGVLVAVGIDGAIGISRDGWTWERRRISRTAWGGPVELLDVAGCEEGAVAVGRVPHDGAITSGLILELGSGLEPDPARSLTVSWPVNAVACNGSSYLAVGDGGTLLRRPGTEWTETTLPGDGELRDVIWAEGLSAWLAAGAAGPRRDDPGWVLMSSDGVEWTELTDSLSFQVEAMVRSEEELVVVGDDRSARTTDGLVWTEQDMRPWTTFWDVVWTGSRFIAVGTEPVVDMPSRLLTASSPDGSSWDVTPVGWGWADAIAWDGRELVLVGHQGMLALSEDGAEWAFPQAHDRAVLALAQAADGRLLASAVSIFHRYNYALAPPVVVGRSDDGLDWTWSGIGGLPLAFASSPDATIFTSRWGLVWRSEDLETWEPVSEVVDYSVRLTGAAWGDPGFVAAGSRGLLGHSPDGRQWTWLDLEQDSEGWDVAWSGSCYVAVGGSVVASSLSGLSWTLQTLTLEGAAVDLKAVAGHDGRVVAVGSSGVVAARVAISGTSPR
jgi:hypothetical protein